MKAYKGFNHDWTCNGVKFEVGKEYTCNEDISLCAKGFHAYLDLQDCLSHYGYVVWNKFAEVEIRGRFIGDSRDSKIVTDKIYIVREIPYKDIPTMLGLTDTVHNSHGVNQSFYVNNSNGINNSYYVHDSSGLDNSDAVVNSESISHCVGIENSSGVNKSEGIKYSFGINMSYYIDISDGVNNSRYIKKSEGISNSFGITNSSCVNESKGVSNSRCIDDSFGIENCVGLSNGLFCADMNESYFLFNKRVTKKRYDEVKQRLNEELGTWNLSFSNLKELYLKAKCYRHYVIPHALAEVSKEDILKDLSNKEIWRNMPQGAINYLKSLPEFDADIFKRVTGMEEK